MPRVLPPLSALPSFEATVRLGSMSNAARELGRTHGAVSRQITALEHALGVTLIVRGSTPLRPTPAGGDLYAAVSGAFELIGTSAERIKPASRRTSAVTVACGSTFATRWLVPRLPRFYEKHPDVMITLAMIGASIAELDDFDIHLSWHRLNYDVPDDAHAHVLGDVVFMLVCAPNYPHRVVKSRLHVATNLVADWPATTLGSFRGKAQIDPVAKRSMHFPHTHLCVEAAIGGLGVTLIEKRVVESELASGRLVAPLGGLTVPDGFVAVPHRLRPLTSAGRKVVAWLRQEAS